MGNTIKSSNTKKILCDYCIDKVKYNVITCNKCNINKKTIINPYANINKTVYKRNNNSHNSFSNNNQSNNEYELTIPQINRISKKTVIDPYANINKTIYNSNKIARNSIRNNQSKDEWTIPQIYSAHAFLTNKKESSSLTKTYGAYSIFKRIF